MNCVPLKSTFSFLFFVLSRSCSSACSIYTRHQELEVTVTFRPRFAGSIETTIYCDITGAAFPSASLSSHPPFSWTHIKTSTHPFEPPRGAAGRESRLPLKLKGDALGPMCELPFDELDMGVLFLGSAHTYQLQLTNRGEIPADFRFTCHESAFTSHFRFRPEMGTVQPGEQFDIEVRPAVVSDADSL